MRRIGKLKERLLRRSNKPTVKGSHGDAVAPSWCEGSEAASDTGLIIKPETLLLPSGLHKAIEVPTSAAVQLSSKKSEEIALHLTSAQPTTFDMALTEPSCETDPWTWAYSIVQDREPELMSDFKAHLADLDPAAEGDLSTLQSVRHIVDQLSKAREAKQWRVPLLNKDIKIREHAEGLVKFLLWSDPIFKTALSAQPYAALAWSSVSLLLPLLTSATSQNEAMLKGFESINDIQVYWNICENDYLKFSRRNELIERIARLYSHIIEYQARVICHLSKTQLSRAWQKVAGWKDWDAKAQDVQKLSQQCSDYFDLNEKKKIEEQWSCQLQEIRKSRVILDTIRQILEASGRQTRQIYEDQKETELLRDLASDYKGNKDFNPRRVEGTCRWFLNDKRFQNWRDSNTSSLLWVSAGPGVGKSVLSRALIDEHHLYTNISTSTICYFFFRDGDDINSALSAILHQLISQDLDGSMIRNALRSHRSHGKSLTQNFSELWQILMKYAQSPDAGEIICLLDALDECKEDGRRQLFAQLQDLYQQNKTSSNPTKLRFLITSRPYDHMELSFGKLSDTTAYIHFDGDDKSGLISREINLVIDEKLKMFTRSFPQEVRRVISQRLKSMEHRTYLWLHLVFDIIEKSPIEYTRRRDIERLLSGLPSQISDAYEKILSRSKDRIQTKILLQIVLAAARPLTLDEANVALTLALSKDRFESHTELLSDRWPTEHFRSVVRNLCGLFISVHDSKLYFIHQTAREFLVDSEPRGQWQGCLSMSEAHSTVSLACLHNLFLPDLYDLISPYAHDLRKPYHGCFPNHHIQYLSPFLYYAALYWTLHYVSQEDVVAERSLKDARMLCKVDGPQISLWTCFHPRLWRHVWRGRPELVLASDLGLKLVVCEILQEATTDINTQTIRDGTTALQAASARGHKEIVQILLANNAEVNLKSSAGTALQLASVGGHIEVVRMLLDNGANVNIHHGYYGTALQEASASAHKDIVQVLLDHGADVNAQYKGLGTALQIASASSHKQLVQILLDYGANINAHHESFGTALQIAASSGDIELAQILLDRGADVSVQHPSFGTAFQIASACGHEELVDILLDTC
ncbi:hypothetical protein F5B20DRAFT_549960 [Whalleya microplaca]|nr:hypothetical protein F5B20DRAFT_549960 [Whalleya microplaca]